MARLKGRGGGGGIERGWYERGSSSTVDDRESGTGLVLVLAGKGFLWIFNNSSNRDREEAGKEQELAILECLA